jgi:hypothetical protein
MAERLSDEWWGERLAPPDHPMFSEPVVIVPYSALRRARGPSLPETRHADTDERGAGETPARTDSPTTLNAPDEPPRTGA